jgi:hypothetical protein
MRPVPPRRVDDQVIAAAITHIGTVPQVSVVACVRLAHQDLIGNSPRQSYAIPMGDELRAHLGAMRKEFNDGQGRLLNRLASLEQDFQNTRGFLVGDAIVSSEPG